MNANIVDLAWQIIEMQRTIKDQEMEIKRLLDIEDKYKNLLDSSVKHSEVMAINTIKLLMTPGVAEACHSATSKKEA